MPIIETLKAPRGEYLDVYRNPAKSELFFLMKQCGGYRMSIDVERDVAYAWNAFIMIHHDVLMKLDETKDHAKTAPFLHLDVGPDNTDVGVKSLKPEHIALLISGTLRSDKYLSGDVKSTISEDFDERAI